MNDVRSLILDKAKDRFDRFGYKKTTMDEISKDCRISKKTIYEHFQDKENLFDCLMVRETLEAKNTIFARTKGIVDPLRRMEQLIHAAIDYFNEDNFVTRLLKDEEDLFSAFLTKKYSREIEEEIISEVAEIIKEGEGLGIFREVDEKLVAYAIFKLFQSFSHMRTIEFSAEKEEQGYYTAVLADFVTNALIKK